jgi:hypothetical protein
LPKYHRARHVAHKGTQPMPFTPGSQHPITALPKRPPPTVKPPDPPELALVTRPFTCPVTGTLPASCPAAAKAARAHEHALDTEGSSTSCNQSDIQSASPSFTLSCHAPHRSKAANDPKRSGTPATCTASKRTIRTANIQLCLCSYQWVPPASASPVRQCQLHHRAQGIWLITTIDSPPAPLAPTARKPVH